MEIGDNVFGGGAVNVGGCLNGGGLSCLKVGAGFANGSCFGGLCK